MAQQTFSIRMDAQLKKEFDALVEDMGMNATTAFNIFARAVVREKKDSIRNRNTKYTRKIINKETTRRTTQYNEG